MLVLNYPAFESPSKEYITLHSILLRIKTHKRKLNSRSLLNLFSIVPGYAVHVRLDLLWIVSSGEWPTNITSAIPNVAPFEVEKNKKERTIIHAFGKNNPVKLRTGTHLTNTVCSSHFIIRQGFQHNRNNWKIEKITKLKSYQLLNKITHRKLILKKMILEKLNC